MMKWSGQHFEGGQFTPRNESSKSPRSRGIWIFIRKIWEHTVFERQFSIQFFFLNAAGGRLECVDSWKV